MMTKLTAGFTASEATALRYAFSSEHGAMAAPVSRQGGAFRRVVERLASEGLLTEKPPFRLTVAGHRAHVKLRLAMWGDSGCMAYLEHLRDAEAALGVAEQAGKAAAPPVDPAPVPAHMVGRDWEGEQEAARITGRYRAAGFHGFRVECDKPGTFWVQPSSNGAILATGRTAREAVIRFANSAAALLRAVDES